MAMTKKLWSINALATEFGLDRRTVGLRIRAIPPAGQLAGHDAWALDDVAPVLASGLGQVRPSVKQPTPEQRQAVDEIIRVFARSALALAKRRGADAAALKLFGEALHESAAMTGAKVPAGGIDVSEAA